MLTSKSRHGRFFRNGRPRTAVLVAAAIIAGGGLTALVIPMASAATCTDVDVVIARGTGEPGNLGAIVGDPVFRALQGAANGLTLTGTRVEYPASLSPRSPTQGNQALVDHVNAQAAACPNQQFVLVGYSQGANVVDNSIGVSSEGALVGGRIVATIPDNIQQQVAAVLLFGNPIRARGDSVQGVLLADRTLDNCANGDPICGGGANIAAHLSYGGNAREAAAVAAARLGQGA